MNDILLPLPMGSTEIITLRDALCTTILTTIGEDLLHDLQTYKEKYTLSQNLYQIRVNAVACHRIRLEEIKARVHLRITEESQRDGTKKTVDMINRLILLDESVQKAQKDLLTSEFELLQSEGDLKVLDRLYSLYRLLLLGPTSPIS